MYTYNIVQLSLQSGLKQYCVFHNFAAPIIVIISIVVVVVLKNLLDFCYCCNDNNYIIEIENHEHKLASFRFFFVQHEIGAEAV